MKNDDEVLRQYISAEAKFHVEKLAALEGEYNNAYSSTYNKWCKRTQYMWDKLADLDVEIPDSFLKIYPIPFQEFIVSRIAMKYQIRGYNCLRELLRSAVLIPEILDTRTHYSVLELSSGACGNYEVLKHFNNSVQVTDFVDGTGSAYVPIHNWLNVNALTFNGAELPYKMADNSYDYILCYQAIDAYGPPRKWSKFVSEMVRIAKNKIVIILNPYHGHKKSQLFCDFISETYPNTTIGLCPDTGNPSLTINLN